MAVSEILVANAAKFFPADGGASLYFLDLALHHFACGFDDGYQAGDDALNIIVVIDDDNGQYLVALPTFVDEALCGVIARFYIKRHFDFVSFNGEVLAGAVLVGVFFRFFKLNYFKQARFGDVFERLIYKRLAALAPTVWIGCFHINNCVPVSEKSVALWVRGYNERGVYK